MNLSPQWESWLISRGIDAVHWIHVGKATATDEEIFTFAKLNQYIVFTNDLDFGTILASTNAPRPSVIQVRGQDLIPDRIGTYVVDALVQFRSQLTNGCLLTLDTARVRVRLLPLNE
jgi:predicted nuclease of predicted toxin-antitoxin system